jgi:flavin reductase (DIM6/NTAB) family NADH-FMN oxidoreductase RutF
MPETDPVKNILRTFSYGLFVAASIGAEGPRAATVSWVTQVSFEPKQVAVAMRKGTAICEAVQASRRFVLHMVGSHQPDFARVFFKGGAAGPEEIAGYRYRLSEHGMPIFEAAAAWLACEVVEESNLTGDHAVFIAAIRGGEIQTPGFGPLALRDTLWHYGG